MLKIPSMRHLMEAITPLLPEHWEQIDTPIGPINVGWQISKDASNKADHDGLSLRDGIPVIANPDNPYTVQHDEQGQENDKIIGLGAGHKQLVVICQRVDTGEEIAAVRIVSVWIATANDKREVGMNEDATPVQPVEPKPQTWGRWGDRLAAMIADQKAIYATRKAKEAQPSGSDQKPNAAE
jgi:hypothetical protein